MAAQDEDPQAPDPNLEPPRLLGRRRTTPPAEGDTRVFDDTALGFADSGSDVDASAPSGDGSDPAAPDPAAPAKGRRRFELPFALPSRLHAETLTAAAAGLVTGIFLLAAMWVAFRGCELARGNESCGPGTGMTALVVVFALTVVAGRFLLHLLKQPEPGMTSFLAVGLTSLVAVLLLNGLFDSAAILVVLPVLSAAAFALAAWVATLELDSD